MSLRRIARGRNGTIESACKQVIRAFRSVLAELRMYTDGWPEAINMVLRVLNNHLATKLNRRTPMQVFSGHTDTTPLALRVKENVPVNVSLDFIKAQKLMEFEKFSKAMTEIYAQVAETATPNRKSARFRSTTTRRRCGRRNSKWMTTCSSRNTATAVRQSFR
jgi:hypothetical protein